MLMRHAEVEMDSEFPSSKRLAVYVNFKTSTLLEGVKAKSVMHFKYGLEATSFKLSMINSSC